MALFASGNGSNVQRIAEYFAHKPNIVITAVYCNKPGAYVIERAKKLGIDVVEFDRDVFYNSQAIAQDLLHRNTDLVVLAGFLWLIPVSIIEAFPKRIINIHPALLPAYGGKGMYGMKVHQAVIASGEKRSGITIHFVNEKYDEGHILFQAECPVNPDDSAETLAAKIHKLEYEHFPVVIDSLIREGKVS
jgi:phosphoribosylglycinamide formyltransferase-1